MKIYNLWQKNSDEYDPWKRILAAETFYIFTLCNILLIERYQFNRCLYKRLVTDDTVQKGTSKCNKTGEKSPILRCKIPINIRFFKR